MSKTSLDIDAVLTRAGETWRRTQPPPPEPDLARLTRTVRPTRRVAWWTPAAAVAAVTLVLVLVGVPLMTHHRPAGPTGYGSPSASARPSGPTATPGPSAPPWLRQPMLPPDTGAGVPVAGTGELFRDGNGPIRFCSAVAATTDGPPPSTMWCQGASVPTTGATPSLLRFTSRKGQAATLPYVRVHGRFHNGTLAVDSVTELPNGTRPPWSLIPQGLPDTPPCPAPAGGWGRYVQSPALEGHVKANANRFTMLQILSDVYVVGTTGDVAAARSELTAIYSGNLCVYHARFSADDLQQTAWNLNALTSVHLYADAVPELDKVRVTVAVFDADTVRALGDTADPEALLLDPPLLSAR